MMNFKRATPFFRHAEKKSIGESDAPGAAAGRAQASLFAAIFGPATRQWLEKHLAPEEGGKGLHLGCGSGEDTLMIASVLGENTTLYGIDEDAALIEAARQEKARRGLGHVHFAQGNLTAWNAAQPCDFIYTRIQASALPAPEAWLAGLAPNLKAGGVLLVEVIKPSGFRAYPYNHAFARAMELIGRLEEAQPCEAEVLPGRLQHAGFTDIVSTYVTPAFIPPACNHIASLSLECYQAGILRRRDSNREELNALLLELRTYEQQEDTLISRPGVLQLWVRKG